MPLVRRALEHRRGLGIPAGAALREAAARAPARLRASRPPEKPPLSGGRRHLGCGSRDQNFRNEGIGFSGTHSPQASHAAGIPAPKVKYRALGVAFFPDDGNEVGVLVAPVDSALYASTHGRRIRLAPFIPGPTDTNATGRTHGAWVVRWRPLSKLEPAARINRPG